MKKAGIEEGDCTIYELTKPFLLRLLNLFYYKMCSKSIA